MRRGWTSKWIELGLDGHDLDPDLGLVFGRGDEAEVLAPECAQLVEGRVSNAAAARSGNDLIENVVELILRGVYLQTDRRTALPEASDDGDHEVGNIGERGPVFDTLAEEDQANMLEDRAAAKPMHR